MAAATLAKAGHLVGLCRYAEARTELTAFLASEPDSTLGWCLLATCEISLDHPAEALQAAGRALAVDPHSARALRLRSIALSDMDRLVEAWEAGQAAVRADPNDWHNHYTLAQVYLLHRERAAERRVGGLQPARRAAQRAVELAPHQPDAQVMWGIAQSATGRGDEARESYRRALELDPQHVFALNNLATLDLDNSKLASGARHVVAGLRQAPGERALQRNLDAVGLHLLARVFNVNLVALFVLVLVAGIAHGAWPPRAAVGAAIVVADVIVVWLTMRHLPGGARRHLRGLPRRMISRQRVIGVVLIVATLAALVYAFYPGRTFDLGISRSAVVIVAIRLIIGAAISRRQRA